MYILQRARMLIPAHAGVIPFTLSFLDVQEPYPRACGGDPKLPAYGIVAKDLSPRMRG